MRNIFVKNYLAFAMLILVSFTFTGGVFMAQVSRYSIQEKQEQLDTTVNYINTIVENNLTLLDSTDYNTFLQTYMDQQAAVSGCIILLTDEEGNIQILSLPQEDEDLQKAMQGTVSDKLAATIREKGSYFGTGNISGLFTENYFIAGSRCERQDGTIAALVIAATPSTSTTGLMRNIMRSYLLIICITLILTLIISWFLSDMLTRPLKSLVSAAKKFGHGEFDVRVSENNLSLIHISEPTRPY